MNYGAFPYQGTRLPDPQWAQDVDSTESEVRVYIYCCCVSAVVLSDGCC